MALALHMKLLRTLQRNTDIDWLLSDAAYAREILRLCREHEREELSEWVGPLENLITELEAGESTIVRAPLDIDIGALEVEALTAAAGRHRR